MGRNCCVHVGSAAIFRRTRHAALPVSGHSQLLGPETQDVTQVQESVSVREGRKLSDLLCLLPVSVDESWPLNARRLSSFGDAAVTKFAAAYENKTQLFRCLNNTANLCVRCNT